MALVAGQPVKWARADSVVPMYSSRLARVAGPALSEEIEETTSTYSTPGWVCVMA